MFSISSIIFDRFFFTVLLFFTQVCSYNTAVTDYVLVSFYREKNLFPKMGLTQVTVENEKGHGLCM